MAAYRQTAHCHNCGFCKLDPTVLQVTYRQADRSKSVRTSCRHMVVSAVQSLDNMRAIVKDLDLKEKAAFEGVTHNMYSQVIFRSAAKNVSNLAFVNVLNLSNKDLPTTVAYSQVHPAYGYALSVNLTPDDTAEAAAARMYTNLTRWSAATNGEFVLPGSIKDALLHGPELHQHTPRAKVPKDTPQLYKRLYALQGYRQMYYTGALYAYNSQKVVWMYSQWLVDNHLSRFPRC